MDSGEVEYVRFAEYNEFVSQLPERVCSVWRQEDCERDAEMNWRITT